MLKLIKGIVLCVKAIHASSEHNSNDAIKLYNTVISLNPAWSFVYTFAVQELLKTNRLDEAVVLIKRGISQRPSDHTLYLLMAAILAIRNESEDEIRYYLNMHDDNTQAFWPLYMRAFIIVGGHQEYFDSLAASTKTCTYNELAWALYIIKKASSEESSGSSGDSYS